MSHYKLLKKLSITYCLLLLSACDHQSPDRDVNPTDNNNSNTNPPPVAGRCSDFREGFKNVYFGDHHTHTSFSLDAYFFNALSNPRTAHRFAKGAAPAPFPPKGTEEVFTVGRELTIDRPLDFNAVTDHAEFLGGFNTACDSSTQTQQECDTRIGQGIRDDILNIAAGNTSFQQQALQAAIANSPSTAEAWNRTKTIVDEENEPCTYTTLHGYEYSSNELSQMFHRNIIFKGNSAQVPANVIPAVLPTTATNAENGNDDYYLFDRLQADCNAAIGCQALTIIHNSNRSDGRYFLAAGEDSGMTVIGNLTGVPLGRKVDLTGTLPGTPGTYMPMTTADAELRRSFDRNFEMSQHKGQSECAVGAEGNYLASDESVDPNCDFEVDKSVCAGDGDDPAACAQFCTGNPATDPFFCSLNDDGQNLVDICLNGGPDGSARTAAGGDGTNNCLSPLDYYRNAMSEGLLIKQTLGINPYRVNITAALDTHNGDSGNAKEHGFFGHGGVLDDEPAELLGFWNCDDRENEDPNDVNNCTNRTFVDFARGLNTGGLAGLWVEENTRDAIWNGLHSGESFGTSGTRLRIRTVASWAPLPTDVCDQLAAGRDLIAGQIVSNGVAMGGDLPPPPSGAGAPYIAVYAMQDPDGNPLQQIDIIKGYINAAGEAKNRVFSAVTATSNPVNLPSPETCAVPVDNHPATLCATWQDPDFDASSDSYWYARALEVPSCRWSDYLCSIESVDADGNSVDVDCGLLDTSNGVFPANSGLQGYEGCCKITENNGVFSGEKYFSPIKERAWASPIWYEVN